MGEPGLKLSGRQKQHVAIARTLLNLVMVAGYILERGTHAQLSGSTYSRIPTGLRVLELRLR